MTTVAHPPARGYRTTRLPLAEEEYERFLGAGQARNIVLQVTTQLLCLGTNRQGQGKRIKIFRQTTPYRGSHHSRRPSGASS
jgi:hypothetical protein